VLIKIFETFHLIN